MKTKDVMKFAQRLADAHIIASTHGAAINGCERMAGYLEFTCREMLRFTPPNDAIAVRLKALRAEMLALSDASRAAGKLLLEKFDAVKSDPETVKLEAEAAGVHPLMLDEAANIIADANPASQNEARIAEAIERAASV